MYDILIIRNGEVAIKGLNRPVFENKLIKNIEYTLYQFKSVKVKKGDGRIYVHLNGEDSNQIIKKIKNVFGVVSISPAIVTESGYENLKEGIKKLVDEKTKDSKLMTFKVNAKRLDKRFPMKSPEMSIDLGGYVLKTFPQRFKVDVVNPDLNITAELRADSNIIFADKIKGVGGLPRGINGKGCILLSGGIDSPVAAYLMSKRGLYIEAVHFHSFPFTSEKSQEKIMDLARTLLPYTGQIKIHMVNLLEIQQSIAENCPEELMTILSRRFMMAIAERIATETECNCLITGESMGQVASQTAEGLLATNNAVKLLPVFRPLISYDKEDIITLAKEIDTFDVSIIPEEDCCTVFLPMRPATKPKLEKILKAEENLNIEMLINNAIDSRVIKEMKKFE